MDDFLGAILTAHLNPYMNPDCQVDKMDGSDAEIAHELIFPSLRPGFCSSLLKMLRIGAYLQKAEGNALMTAIPQLLHSFSLNRRQLQHRQPYASMNKSTDNLDAIFQQKRALRSKIRKDLKAMSPEQKREEDIAIQNIVLEAPWFKSSSRICAYISCDALREVDTSKILSDVLHAPTGEHHSQIKRKLYVPRVEDKNSHMRMFNISSMEDLIANSMNILEPAPVDANGNEREDVMQATQPVDLVLIPGLAFDKSGGRLGRGGGYYDAFLKKYQDLAAEQNWKRPLLVALAYSVQIMDEEVIPMTPKDVLVDALVCPNGVIPISPVAVERM